MARGTIYEITDKEHIEQIGAMSESDFYDYAGHEFDFADTPASEEEHKTAIEMLLESVLNKHAKDCETTIVETFDGPKTVYVLNITDEVKERHFAARFDEAKHLLNDMSLHEFACKDQYKLQAAVEDTYGDAVYLNSSLDTLDAFIRNADPNKAYYLGTHVIYMH